MCHGLKSKEKFKPTNNSIRLCKKKNLSKVMIQDTFVVTVCTNNQIIECTNMQ